MLDVRDVAEVEVGDRLPVGDDVMRDAFELLARREPVRDADDEHAGGPGGGDAVEGVLEHDAAAGPHVEEPGGEQVWGGVRLAAGQALRIRRDARTGVEV